MEEPELTEADKELLEALYEAIDPEAEPSGWEDEIDLNQPPYGITIPVIRSR